MVPFNDLGSLLGSIAPLTVGMLAEASPDLGRAAGRLHPLVVHFPIALALVAVGAEWWRSLTRQQGMSPLTRPLLWIAAISAVFATATGWINAAHEHDGDISRTLDLHRWIGTGTTVALLCVAWWCQALTATLIRPSAEAMAQLGSFRWIALVGAIAVSVTGHLGGELVYGSGYLTKVLFPGAAAEKEEIPAIEAPTVQQAAMSPADTYFVEKVRPILEAHCFECHGARKQKGGLRMDSKSWLFNGEESEWTVIPGNSTESELHARVILDRADPDAMPPEGPGLTQEEIGVLEKWIDDGAAYPNMQSGGAGVPGSNSAANAAALSAVGTIAIAGGSTVEIAPDLRARADTAGRALSARGALVQPLALESVLVDVNASRAEPPLGDAEAGLLTDLAPVVANLNLAKSAISDAGLAKVGPMMHLERLRVDQTLVGDAGLAALGTLPRLESINLVGSKVTPASIAWLRSQPALRRVYVWQTALDNPEAIKQLTEGGKLEVIGADLPLAQPKTPPMPEEAKSGEAKPEEKKG
ncbi:MAG: hypothetical protein RLY21_2755 [Planctomycetota bacterium]|jgi:uncharacterized membrane protein/mono/diheme cytochrome c family protein